MLEPNRTPRTLVLVLHKEAVNHHHGMAYFGGIFGDGEVSVRALDFILKGSFPNACHFGFSWILEDEGIYKVLFSTYGVVLYQTVFRLLVLGV